MSVGKVAFVESSLRTPSPVARVEQNQNNFSVILQDGSSQSCLLTPKLANFLEGSSLAGRHVIVFKDGEDYTLGLGKQKEATPRSGRPTFVNVLLLALIAFSLLGQTEASVQKTSMPKSTPSATPTPGPSVKPSTLPTITTHRPTTPTIRTPGPTYEPDVTREPSFN